MHHLLRILLPILLALGCIGPASAQETDFAHHYEYTFLLRDQATPDVLARARAALPSTLAHHRLVDPATLARWDGKGVPPMALALRSKPLSEIRLQETFETSEPLGKVMGLRPSDTVALVDVMIGVPPQLDVPAYIEALTLSLAVGKALRAPAFTDSETGELQLIGNLGARLRWGLRGEQRAISVTNPPALTIMGGITQLERLADEGRRTNGLRKLGLPDIALERGVPGISHLWLMQTAGNLLISGKVSPTIGTVMTFRTEDPEVAAELYGGGRPGGVGRVRLATSELTPGPVLRLEIEGPPGLHEFERQMLFYSAMGRSRYPSLSDPQEATVLRAIGRAKARVAELQPKLEELRRTGTRIFFVYNVEALLKDLRGGDPQAAQQAWNEFIGWTEHDGYTRTRRWQGDPRRGGTPGEGESHMPIGSVEDVLVIDARGKAQGGEVIELLERFVAEARKR